MCWVLCAHSHPQRRGAPSRGVVRRRPDVHIWGQGEVHPALSNRRCRPMLHPCEISASHTLSAPIALSQLSRNEYVAEAVWTPQRPERKKQKANPFVFWAFVSQNWNFLNFSFSSFFLIQPMICHYNQGKLYTSSGDLDNIFYTDGAVRRYLRSQNCNGWLFLLVANRRLLPSCL